MKQLLTTALLTLSVLALMATSTAWAADAPDKAVRGEDQEFIYTPDELATKLLQPVPVVSGLPRTSRQSLIQLRWDFIDKIVDSSRSI